MIIDSPWDSDGFKQKTSGFDQVFDGKPEKANDNSDNPLHHVLSNFPPPQIITIHW